MVRCKRKAREATRLTRSVFHRDSATGLLSDKINNLFVINGRRNKFKQTKNKLTGKQKSPIRNTLIQIMNHGKTIVFRISEFRISEFRISEVTSEVNL